MHQYENRDRDSLTQELCWGAVAAQYGGEMISQHVFRESESSYGSKFTGIVFLTFETATSRPYYPYFPAPSL